MMSARPCLPYPDSRFSTEAGKTRVLFECSDAGVAWAGERILRDAGYDVAVCWGPRAHREAVPCPLMSEGRCPLVDQADVVVQSFALSERERFPILRAMRERLPDKPLCVEVAQPSRGKYGRDLKGCTVLDLPMTSSRLVEAVDSLARRSRRRAGGHEITPRTS